MNHATFHALVKAYFDCRKHKRNTLSAVQFEMGLESNLADLYRELRAGTYRPGRSICFVITRPKAREVWAAEFRDRIVHHLLYNHVAELFHNSFISDSCACIPGRGTLYAAKRLESKIRSATQNWSRPVFYLKMDLANFFVSIDKAVLRELLAKKITEPWWMALAETILFHDPRKNFIYRGDTALLHRVPDHKQLAKQPENNGLPIGNLSSQFFANVLLNELDQFAKHQIKAKHYIRYVDDFILLHESAQWLNDAKERITQYVTTFGLAVNPRKTILQPVDRGVDFVGQVIKPWRRETRRRTFRAALTRTKEAKPEDVFKTANSYFGLLGQASKSHGERCALANQLRLRGCTINGDMTKTFRRAA